MSSDTIVNTLFEIAQTETNEVIYFNDFCKELRDNFNELTNDEYDEALVVINQQVKNGNKLLEPTSGTISVSSQIIKSAKNTVEYTKQMKERSVLENREKLKTSDIIITGIVINEMLNNYDKLSAEEKEIFINNLNKVDIEKMGSALRNIAKDWNDIPDKTEDTIFASKVIEGFSDLFDAYTTGDKKAIEDYYKKNPAFYKKIQDIRAKNPNISDSEAAREVVSHATQVFNKYLSQIREEIKDPEEYKKIKEEYEEYKKIFPEEYEKAVKEFQQKEKGTEKTVEGVQQKKKAVEEADKAIEFLDEQKIGNQEELISDDTLNEEISQLPIAFSQYGFEADKIKNAMEQYKKYFENLEYDDLQFLSEQTDKDLSNILKEEFQEMEVDDRVGQILEIMSNINYHGEISNILTNPEKRKSFLQRFENTIGMNFEKIQADIESQKDTELIKDSELAELFKQASVELQVAPFEPAREGLESEFFNMPTDEADKSAVPSTEVDGIYIYNGVLMEVDKEFTQIATDAQERGEDLEKAILEYYEKQQQEKAEQERASEEKEEHVEPEIIVVDERGEQAQEQEAAMQDEFFRADEETGEEIQASDGQDKNVVVIKKGKEGTIQVFRPSSFLKVVKQSEITFDKVKDVQNELARIVEQERENGEKPGASKGNGNQSSKDDSWEY